MEFWLYYRCDLNDFSEVCSFDSKLCRMWVMCLQWRYMYSSLLLDSFLHTQICFYWVIYIFLRFIFQYVEICTWVLFMVVVYTHRYVLRRFHIYTRVFQFLIDDENWWYLFYFLLSISDILICTISSSVDWVDLIVDWNIG